MAGGRRGDKETRAYYNIFLLRVVRTHAACVCLQSISALLGSANSCSHVLMFVDVTAV